MVKGGALGEAVFTGKQRIRREKKCSNRKTAQRTIIETEGTNDLMAVGLSYGFFAERVWETDTNNLTGSREDGQKRT